MNKVFQPKFKLARTEIQELKVCLNACKNKIIAQNVFINSCYEITGQQSELKFNIL